MNKKFLSAILFGALTAASTSTFVSCNDYDDDIDRLQMQIDQNAQTASDELATKVAALESQLSALNAAKEDLASQLTAAKEEAATATANALAAANGAQASADAVAKDLTNALARVATLETKLGTLEEVVNDLKVAKAELSTKVADLQTQMAAVKNDVKANADAIAASNAEILAKYTELSNKISEVSSSIGARIDVIDATLNTIQANYATNDALNTKAEELAATDAQLKAQIEANLKYIQNLETVVAELKTKDETLAGKISEIAEKQAENLAKIEAIEKTISTLNATVEGLQSSKADKSELAAVQTLLTNHITTVEGMATTNATDIKTLKENVATLQQNGATKEELSKLQEDVKALIEAETKKLNDAINEVKATANQNKTDIEALQKDLKTVNDSLYANIGENVLAIAEVNAELATLQGDVAGLKTTVENNLTTAKAYADEVAQNVATTLGERLTTVEGLLQQLSDMTGDDLSAFITEDELDSKLEGYLEDLDAQFDAQKDSLAKEFETLEGEYKTFEDETKARIEEEITKLKEYNETLVVLQNTVAILGAKVDALINNIQSIVFVPQYSDVDVPVYGYVHDAGAVNAEVSIKFRLEPATAAADVVALWGAEGSKLSLELESSDALKAATRADYNYFEVTGVKAEGAFLVVNAKHNIPAEGVHPTTLVVGNEWAVDTVNNESVALSKTSDYFNVELITLNGELAKKYITKQLEDDSIAIYDEHITFESESSELEVVGTAVVEIHNNYFVRHELAYLTSNYTCTEFVLPTVSDSLIITNVDEIKDNKYFDVTAEGVAVKGIKVGEDVLPDTTAIGQSIIVKVADQLYGKTGDNWNVVYDVVYTITENTFDAEFDLGNIEIVWPDENDTIEFTVQMIETADAQKSEGKKLADYGLNAQALYKYLYAEIDTLSKMGADHHYWTEDPDDKNRTRIELVAENDVIYMVGLSNINESNYNDGDQAYAGKLDVVINHVANVTFKGAVKLEIPSAEAYLEKLAYYWTDENDIALNVNYSYSELVDKYIYTVEMPTAYTNYKKFTSQKYGNNTIDYVWTLNDYEGEKLSGIEFSGDTLKITGPITTASGKVLDINKDNVTFNLTVKAGPTVLATAENQKFKVTYPVDEFKTPVDVELTADSLKVGSTAAMNVISEVTLTDDDNAIWVENGKIVESDRTAAWDVNDLEFEVVKIYCPSIKKDYTNDVDANGEKLFKVENGALVVVDPARITKTVEVTIKVSVDYTFEEDLSAEYTVTVLPMDK